MPVAASAVRIPRSIGSLPNRARHRARQPQFGSGTRARKLQAAAMGRRGQGGRAAAAKAEAEAATAQAWRSDNNLRGHAVRHGRPTSSRRLARRRQPLADHRHASDPFRPACGAVGRAPQPGPWRLRVRRLRQPRRPRRGCFPAAAVVARISRGLSNRRLCRARPRGDWQPESISQGDGAPRKPPCNADGENTWATVAISSSSSGGGGGGDRGRNRGS